MQYSQNEYINIAHWITSLLQQEYLDEKGAFQKNWPPADKQNAGLPRAIRMHLTLKNWGKISQTYVLAGEELDTKTH